MGPQRHVRLVVVSGGGSVQSRSRILGDAIAARVQACLATVRTDVQFGALVPEFGAARQRRDVSERVEQALRQIERADLIVAVTPVYNGSYAGHFKHLFDLIDVDALVGTPVALGATGGGERHALMVEHQLRPLFSFFRAQTLPTAIYGAEADFKGAEIGSPALLGRIEAVAAEAIALPQFAATSSRPRQRVLSPAHHPRLARS